MIAILFQHKINMEEKSQVGGQPAAAPTPAGPGGQQPEKTKPMWPLSEFYPDVNVWAAVGILLILALNRTPFGRYVYAIGNSERVTYLSGISTRAVLIAAFVTSGACSAFAGAMLAGYAGKAYQAMGDPYLLPAIAAVVLGGTSILGGQGTYLGTVAGVILITLLQSILSVMQMPEAGRQIIYGVVIVAMLLLYGRSPASR